MTVSLVTRIDRYVGLSSDDKPEALPGSLFFEFDTPAEYVYAPAEGLEANPTNLVTNSGIEVDTTGWAVTANNTIARSTVQKHSGAASLLCTYQDQAGLARFAPTLAAAGKYIFSAWVYIPTAYDGVSVVLSDNGDFVGATGTQLATADMAIRDAWQRLITDFTLVAGDLTGALHIRNSGTAPTAGRFIYVDDAEIYTDAAWQLQP